MHITYHFGVLTCQVRSKLWIHFKTSLGSPDIFLPLTWFPRQRKHPCFVKLTRCRFSKLCSQSELLVWLLWPKHFRLYDRLIPIVVYIDLSPQNALILCRWIFCKFSLVFCEQEIQETQWRYILLFIFNQFIELCTCMSHNDGRRHSELCTVVTNLRPGNNMFTSFMIVK